MAPLSRLFFLVRLTQARRIARRYFVTNGFDGALAMLGMILGFYSSGNVPLSVVLNACLGTTIALGMSGVTSAYISESAEKRSELQELEQALLVNLEQSDHGTAARVIPLYIAAVNGLAPVVIALFIISPVWLAHFGMSLPLPALQLAIILAFITIFCIGIFLGRISGTFWLWSAVKTSLIALLTAAIIFLVE